MRYILLLGSFIFIDFLFSQQINPTAVTSAGASMSVNNTNLNFTIGEITVKTITDGYNSIGQGFTSSSTQTIITSIREPNTDLLQMKLYPNPASDMLFADIENSNEPFIMLSIVDINGRQISKDKYAVPGNHIGINTSHWSSGSYFLTIYNLEGKSLSSYSIVKK